MMDKYIVYQGPSDEKPRNVFSEVIGKQETTDFARERLEYHLLPKPFGELRFDVSQAVNLYCQGVIDTCNAMLRWTRDEMIDLRHGRRFRGRYPTRYAGR